MSQDVLRIWYTKWYTHEIQYELNYMILNSFMVFYGCARSPASLAISSVWKPYIKHNCELDDLRASFEIAK